MILLIKRQTEKREQECGKKNKENIYQKKNQKTHNKGRKILYLQMKIKNKTNVKKKRYFSSFSIRLFDKNVSFNSF